MTRLRIRFTKLGKVRFVSHRDLARIWERASRRAGLPVVMSQGFTPRPRLSFGLALSTGHESLAEYLDAELHDDGGRIAGTDERVAATAARLTAELPAGMEVTAAAVVERGTPSLQESVTSSTWALELRGLTRVGAGERIAAALAAPALPIPRTRKGVASVDDVRPALLGLELRDGGADDPVVLVADLGAQPRALRPAELLVAAFDGCAAATRVVRTHQWIERGGRRHEPVAVPDALRAPVGVHV